MAKYSGGDFYYFNPRPLCGGRRRRNMTRFLKKSFQSTPSVWRATSLALATLAAMLISIHALRVEGDVLDVLHKVVILHFNPRPPCGGRPGGSNFRACRGLFQSTPSVWRATRQDLKRQKTAKPFQSTPSVWRATSYFIELIDESSSFQSTPSVWRATGSPAILSVA